MTIIMYHAVSPELDPWNITPPAFSRQLQTIIDNYPVIRLQDLPGELTKPGPAARKVVLTFDDAYLDFFEHVFPLIREYRVPVTMFVPTGAIDGWNTWDRDKKTFSGRLYPRRRIMSEQQLRQLYASGLVDFGSHSVGHKIVSTLEESELSYQLTESKRRLETLLSAPVESFSYPWGRMGDYSLRTTVALKQTGYRLAVTTRWGVKNGAGNLFTLKRIFFTERDSGMSLKWKIEGKLSWLPWIEPVHYLMRRYLRWGT